LERIIADPGLQVRVALDEGVVSEYAEAMKADGKYGFPPVDVVQAGIGADYLLVDGAHRRAAVLEAGLTEIRARVHQGDRTAALSFALRRSNRDKRRAVSLALKAFPGHSDSMLSELCGVDRSLVASVRDQDGDSTPFPQGKRVGRDGKAYSLPRKTKAPEKDSVEAKPEVPPPCPQPVEQAKQPSPSPIPPPVTEAPAETAASIAHPGPTPEQIVGIFRNMIRNAIAAHPDSIGVFRKGIGEILACLGGASADSASDIRTCNSGSKAFGSGAQTT
jgi:hypothetical protein